MSHPRARRATVGVRRADFLAIGHAALGAAFLLIGAWNAIANGLGLGAVGYAASGVVLVAVAGYYNRNPDLIDRGTRPTPRRWVALGGFVAVALVAVLAGVYAIDAVL